MLLSASLRSPSLPARRLLSFSARCFSGALSNAKQLPPRPKIEEGDIEESFLKGSGPGGQKIVRSTKLNSRLSRPCFNIGQNKTSSAVQLKHLPTGVVVKSQATRSRSQNRSIARKLLAEKLEYMEKGSESRVALKIDVKAKKKANKRKKARRKYGKPDGTQEHNSDAEEIEDVNDEVEAQKGAGFSDPQLTTGRDDPSP